MQARDRLAGRGNLRRFLSMFGKPIKNVILAITLAALPCAAQTAAPSDHASAGAATATTPATPEQTQLLKSAETFLRTLYAWGPDYKLNLGPLTPSPTPDFYALPLDVTLNGQKDSGTVFISKDGKTLIQGEMFDTASDPYAANRSKIHTEGSPFQGPADATVTLVEFADFECPHCRELHDVLGTLEKRYPQVRVVYKDFPLVQIHEWAETAAIGARCAYMQSPAAFWKVHDAIFDNQDLISAENIWEKLNGFAASAGLNADAFKACLASPEAKQAVEANAKEGVALGVNSTPTVYVDGRPNVGGDPAVLNQFIDYELAAHSKK
jgi:protein-disulfide isomerase